MRIFRLFPEIPRLFVIEFLADRCGDCRVERYKNQIDKIPQHERSERARSSLRSITYTFV